MHLRSKVASTAWHGTLCVMARRQDILCMCEWRSRILATADNSGHILVWDLPQGDLKATLSACSGQTDHPAGIVALMFLPGTEPDNPLLMVATGPFPTPDLCGTGSQVALGGGQQVHNETLISCSTHVQATC